MIFMCKLQLEVWAQPAVEQCKVLETLHWHLVSNMQLHGFSCFVNLPAYQFCVVNNYVVLVNNYIIKYILRASNEICCS